MKVELQNITKSFDKKTNTIDNMNLTIEDGEFVALLGPSGCGKTTTMLMIAGIYKPNEGAIYFDGEKVNDLEPKDREIGMVFQSYALYPHMTVLNNIAFPLKQQKVPKKERLERAKEAAEMVQLGHLLNRKPSELSGGQQQRVALARAIVKRPKLLLLDEPMSNLDASLRIEMRAEISRLQKKLGITTILITHDQEEAMTLADRIALMKDGRIVQFDTPMNLYNEPDNVYVAKFIGTPPMNLVEGKIMYNKLQIDKQTYPMDKSRFHLEHGKEVILGMRPYDIQLGWTEEIRFLGKIELLESIGHSKIIHANVFGKRLQLFAKQDFQAEIGAEVRFSVQPAAIHLFDKKTGKSLRKAAPYGDEMFVKDAALQ
ncbi:sugar ABC transporter ATP-binding protein [Compostibacillus humi]|uniref:Sugar ABC transporter ATP-binding protein n=1 Tax=Compostibacillus humi TaxID=1245525 RepID=A0A8J2TSI4_9BACI|nr:ABC transporter ATP-binding protein [Compostibacillus humi]GFZ77852.1 sugar ABC transporter ATP-binding protein [Compostibacillus humi]